MHDSAKYLIHADIAADGVVERSDVVGAIFGQTEGLLGDDLDLRELQEHSKVGRIDVSIRSERGHTFGEVTIASGLDRAETAVLAAALETIDRVGPCRAEFEVTRLEDVRAAKRREIVDRATELLGTFEDEVMSTRELVESVREAHRVADITEYEGLPAGPRVVDSDAAIVVEGRADVLRLLQYGIKNAVAVEGTNVPEAVARLTDERTVTAFLDGDRGGDLILKELQQVGAVDYVVFAPEGRSVEDLSREEVMSGLREKVPVEAVADTTTPHEAIAGSDDEPPAPPEATDAETATAADEEPSATAEQTTQAEQTDDGAASAAAESEERTENGSDDGPATLAGHVQQVVGGDTGEVWLLDGEFAVLATAPAAEAFHALVDADQVPATVVLDGELTQKLLDVAAQRGVEQVIARSEGEFVKQPTSVRVRLAGQFEAEA